MSSLVSLAFVFVGVGIILGALGFAAIGALWFLFEAYNVPDLARGVWFVVKGTHHVAFVPNTVTLEQSGVLVPPDQQSSAPRPAPFVPGAWPGPVARRELIPAAWDPDLDDSLEPEVTTRLPEPRVTTRVAAALNHRRR